VWGFDAGNVNRGYPVEQTHSRDLRLDDARCYRLNKAVCHGILQSRAVFGGESESVYRSKMWKHTTIAKAHAHMTSVR
jgi:hypothetical protein